MARAIPGSSSVPGLSGPDLNPALHTRLTAQVHDDAVAMHSVDDFAGGGVTVINS